MPPPPKHVKHVPKEDIFPLQYKMFGSERVPVPGTTRLLDALFPSWRTVCGSNRGGRFEMSCLTLHRQYGYSVLNATMSFGNTTYAR